MNAPEPKDVKKISIHPGYFAPKIPLVHVFWIWLCVDTFGWTWHTVGASVLVALVTAIGIVYRSVKEPVSLTEALWAEAAAAQKAETEKAK